jgi:hypothetical protein
MTTTRWAVCEGMERNRNDDRDYVDGCGEYGWSHGYFFWDPDDVIELEGGCLVSTRVLRRDHLIQFADPMPPSLSGEELEAHAYSWLHRKETAKVTILATVTKKTRLSVHLEQAAGNTAILPKEIVNQLDGAFFEVPEWTLLDPFDLMPLTVEQGLRHAEWERIGGGFVVLPDFDAIPNGEALLDAGVVAIIGYNLADAFGTWPNPARAIIPKRMASERGLALSMAETNCAKWRRESVPIWLREKGL